MANRVNRTNKVRIAVVVALVGGFVWAFRPGAHPEVSATFLEVSSNDSSVVWFTITNRSRIPIVYFHTAQERLSNSWIDLDYRNRRRIDPSRVHWTLAGHEATNLARSVTYLWPWRMEVAYTEARHISSPLFRTRQALARSASSREWFRLQRWMQPTVKWKYVYGPEMIENRPAQAQDK